MSGKRLRDFILDIRKCKSINEEREVVQAESARVRSDLRNKKTARQISVSKLLFMHLLGYPTDFATVECLNLMVSENFIEKRFGYLALNMLLDETHPMFFMATNSLQRDLDSASERIICLALSTLADIGSEDMCRDLNERVLLMFSHKSCHVKKRAGLAGIRVLRKCPEFVEDYSRAVEKLLIDTSHAVVGSGLYLLVQILKIVPQHSERFGGYLERFQRALKHLVHGRKGDHEHRGTNNPFVQVALLECFGMISKGDEITLDCLNLILSDTDLRYTPSHAIIYECSKAILRIGAPQNLLEIAVKKMSDFLRGRANQKYVALKCLSTMVPYAPSTIRLYKENVFFCLQEEDLSIQVSAIRLLIELVNEDSLFEIVGRLMQVLYTDNGKLKKELVSKLCNVIEKQNVSTEWKFDNLIDIMVNAGEYVSDDTVAEIIDMLLRNQSIQPYATHTLFKVLQGQELTDKLIQLCVWGIGEFCDFLPIPLTCKTIQFEAVTGSQIIDKLEKIINNQENLGIIRYVVSSLGKIAAKLPETQSEIRYVLSQQTFSENIEIQQRACEILALLDQAASGLLPWIFQKIALEASTVPEPQITPPPQALDLLEL